MKMIKSIPALPVINIERAIEFYHAKLCFTIPYHDTGFAKMIRDEVELHLWAASDESWNGNSSLAASPIKSGAESFLAGTASCRIQVQGIEAWYEECKRQGVIYNPDTVVQRQPPWRTKEFSVLDLHRNLITFYELI